MKTVEAELQEILYAQIKALIDGGWFTETHKPVLMAKFVREDVECACMERTDAAPARTVILDAVEFVSVFQQNCRM